MKGSTTKLVKRLGTSEPGKGESRLRFVFVGVMVAITLFVLMKGLFETPDVPDNYTNSRSASPGGHRALAELLRQSGYKVETSVKKLDMLDDDFFEPFGRTIVLLEPGPDHVRNHEKEFRKLFSDERRASIVLVLPKRYYYEEKTDDDGTIVLREELFHPDYCQELLKMAGLENDLSLQRQVKSEYIADSHGAHRTQLVEKEGYQQYFRVLRNFKPERGVRYNSYSYGGENIWQTILQTDDSRPVAVKNDALKLTVVADPDIFSNRFIAVGDAAGLAKAVFDARGPRDLVIDEAMHGLSSNASLEYLAVRPPALWTLLTLLLLIALFYWREATVLRPIEAETETRRSRGLVIEGVAKLMERAQDYGPASSLLVRRAHHALLPARAHVHAAGIAGSTSTVLPKDLEQKLDDIRLSSGSEENLVAVAASISALKRDQASRHKPVQTTQRKEA